MVKMEQWEVEAAEILIRKRFLLEDGQRLERSTYLVNLGLREILFQRQNHALESSLVIGYLYHLSSTIFGLWEG